MFADTGIPFLFKECYRLGAAKPRMIVKVAGGSQVLEGGDYFNIGKRNYAALRKIFLRNQVLIDGEDVGGTVARSLFMDMASGQVWIKSPGKDSQNL